MHCKTNKDDLAFISILKLISLINTRDIKEIQDPSISMQNLLENTRLTFKMHCTCVVKLQALAGDRESLQITYT